MNQTPTPYPDLNSLLQEFITSIQAILGDNFVGFYLQGSFAVGDFDEHSDVDFVIAIQNDIPTKHVEQLQSMHQRIYNLESEWAKHLEGSYFPLPVLRDYTKQGDDLWYLDHGSDTLAESDHCNTIVVRHTTRTHGIAVSGPPPDTLIDAIPLNVLRRDIKTTLEDWGAEILADPDHYNNRFYQAFITLNYCRMLHDLYTGQVSSKAVSTAWAKATLDPVWAELIDRSWAGRPNPFASVRQRADPRDYEQTLAFVKYIIQQSQQYIID